MDNSVLYRFSIDHTEYTSSDLTLTPAQLRVMAAIDGRRVLFQLTPDGSARRLADGETVHLEGHTVEAFISRDPAELTDVVHYRLEIDQVVYESRRAELTALEIKALAGLELSVPLYRRLGHEAVPVADDRTVSLSLTGTEQFVTIQPRAAHVAVSVTYTTTARKKRFQAAPDTMLQQVVERAYDALGETPRVGDALLTGAPGRTDLQPYLHETLQALQTRGLVLGHPPHLSFHLDIDAQTGGA